MAIENGYATVAQFKDDATSISATTAMFDPKIELALESASRDIDAHTGRRHGFWQDAAVVDRYYDPEDAYCCPISDEISTTTGLVVKLDTGLNGTYSTTLTINSHFRLRPHNAAADERPYDEIYLPTSGGYTFITSSDIPYVKVTAKFGWAAVPTAVKKACIIQAAQLYLAADSPFGSAGIGLDGAVIRIRRDLHPLAASLVYDYTRVYC
jgi:hypothetical protein